MHESTVRPSDPRLLTAAEVADLLRLRESTIKRWSRLGCIPSVRITRKVVRFSLDAVIASLRTRPLEQDDRRRSDDPRIGAHGDEP
jgi:excisionase family DNA binding protein